MPDEDVQKTAFVAATITEADLVRGLLEANGIPAIVQGANMVSMLDGMVSGNRGVMVQVPASRIDDALKVIEESHRPVEDDEFEAEDADD